MASFQHNKWSDNKQCTIDVWWGIFIENMLYFYFLGAVINIPMQTHNFTMTPILQDNHLTAGAWVACGATYKDWQQT